MDREGTILLEITIKHLLRYSDFKSLFFFSLIQMIKAKMHKLDKSYYIPVFSWTDFLHE